MIVQTALPGEAPLIIHQLEHTRLAGAFIRVFGNQKFLQLSPAELMEYVVTHHDQGWSILDDTPEQDPETGLPYNLIKTPLHLLIQTLSGSPEFNGQHHPYCALMASMHTWGLYNGRYGLSDKIFINAIAPEYRALVKAKLDQELERQARLTQQLELDPMMAPHVQQAALFRNYKALQFFDTFALYLNMTHPSLLQPTTFLHVPALAGQDVAIDARPVGDHSIALSPFPFATSGVQVAFEGRRLSPQPPGTSLAEALRLAPVQREVFTLVAEA